VTSDAIDVAFCCLVPRLSLRSCPGAAQASQRSWPVRAPAWGDVSIPSGRRAARLKLTHYPAAEQVGWP